MPHIRKLIKARDRSGFSTRISAHDIVFSHAGKDDQQITAARDSDGAWIMVYTPIGEPFQVVTSSSTGCNVSGS